MATKPIGVIKKELPPGAREPIVTTRDITKEPKIGTTEQAVDRVAKLKSQGYVQVGDELRAPEIEYTKYWTREASERQYDTYSPHVLTLNPDGTIAKEVRQDAVQIEVSSTGGWSIREVRPTSTQTFDYKIGVVTTELGRPAPQTFMHTAQLYGRGPEVLVQQEQIGITGIAGGRFETAGDRIGYAAGGVAQIRGERGELLVEQRQQEFQRAQTERLRERYRPTIERLVPITEAKIQKVRGDMRGDFIPGDEYTGFVGPLPDRARLEALPKKTRFEERVEFLSRWEEGAQKRGQRLIDLARQTILYSPFRTKKGKEPASLTFAEEIGALGLTVPGAIVTSFPEFVAISAYKIGLTSIALSQGTSTFFGTFSEKEPTATKIREQAKKEVTRTVGLVPMAVATSFDPRTPEGLVGVATLVAMPSALKRVGAMRPPITVARTTIKTSKHGFKTVPAEPVKPQGISILEGAKDSLRLRSTRPIVSVLSTETKLGRTILDMLVEQKEVPTTIKGKTTVTTLGLEAGIKAQPIVSVIKTTGERPRLQFGDIKPARPIELAELTAQKGLDQPLTALKGKVFRQTLKLTPEETVRIESATKVADILRQDPGLAVEDVLFKVKGLRDPKRASGVIEQFLKEERGVVFGSATTQQLPTPFKSARIGDIDIMFRTKTVKQIERKLPILEERLRAIGEDVMLGKDNELLFTQTGEKFLEAKSGIDQFMLDLDDVAPQAFLGVPIDTGVTVPFGKARATLAGEQLARKASASLIVSPGKLPGETPSFSVAGILGKQGNIRGLKDVAGFIQSGEGLTLLRRQKIGFTKREGLLAEAELTKFKESFTPEQRADIATKFREITGEEIPFRREITKPTTPETRFSMATDLDPRSPLAEAMASRYGLLSPKLESPTASRLQEASAAASVLGSPSAIPGSPYLPESAYPSPREKSPYEIPSPSEYPSLSPPSSPPYSPPSSPPSSPPYSPPYSPPSSPPDTPPFTPPSTPPPVVPPSFAGRGRNQDVFNVLVREARPKGKARISEVKVNEKPIPYNKALNVADRYVDETSARTFRLVKVGRKEVVDDSLFFDEYKYRRTKGASKINPKSFIEKSLYAIDSEGERRSITAKGLKALERKRRGFVKRLF